MPGWSNSDRRQRLPPDWFKIRARVLKRDRHLCQEQMDDGKQCLDHATEVDHIVPGDDHDESNLRAICSWHHARKSSREGAVANNEARARVRKSFRRTEDHPGLL